MFLRIILYFFNIDIYRILLYLKRMDIVISDTCRIRYTDCIRISLILDNML